MSHNTIPHAALIAKPKSCSDCVVDVFNAVLRVAPTVGREAVVRTSIVIKQRGLSNIGRAKVLTRAAAEYTCE